MEIGDKRKERIKLRVKQIISNVAILEIEELDENNSLYDDLEIDPLDILEIVTLIEEEYNVDFTDEIYEEFETIQDIVDKLENLGVKS